MKTASRIKESFLAKVDSGLIRYQGFPVAVVAVAPATDVELVVAGAGPLVDFWLCGFTCGIFGAVAEHTQVLNIGYGGNAGAQPPAVTVVTTFPITIAAEAAALGPGEAPTEMLPYPIRIPGGSRIAVSTVSITGGVTIDEMHVILATAVGT